VVSIGGLELRIREASKHDYEGISILISEVHKLHSQSRPDIFNELQNPLEKISYENIIDSDDYKVLIVENDNKEIIGCTTLRVIRTPQKSILNPRKVVYMEDLCVKKEYRRKGIGKELFYRALEFTKKIGSESMELQVWEFNKSAIKFYQSMKMRNKNRRMEIKV